jgi:enoyl-CoA hydratase/carnithine racemase
LLLFNQKDGYVGNGSTPVTLNRPDALNAFGYRMTCAPAEALRAVRAEAAAAFLQKRPPRYAGR